MSISSRPSPTARHGCHSRFLQLLQKVEQTSAHDFVVAGTLPVLSQGGEFAPAPGHWHFRLPESELQSYTAASPQCFLALHQARQRKRKCPFSLLQLTPVCSGSPGTSPPSPVSRSSQGDPAGAATRRVQGRRRSWPRTRRNRPAFGSEAGATRDVDLDVAVDQQVAKAGNRAEAGGEI